MGVFSLTTAPASSISFFISRTRLPSTSSSSERRTKGTFHFNQKPNAFTVYASKEESPKLNSDDLMELKFGRLIGEDPKLTLAKIMGRKANPDASYLDIEKSYYKNKGKLVKVEEVPFDGSKERRSSNSLDDLGLVRPVSIKTAKFKSDIKPASEIRKTSQPSSKAVNNTKSSVPNIILRKPTVYNQDDDEEMSSRLRIKPNLSLKMRNGQVKEKFSDMTLLRKPEPSIALEIDKNQESYGLVDNQVNIGDELKMRKPDPKIGNTTLSELPDTAGSKTDSQNEDQQFRDVRLIASNDIQKFSDTSEFTGNVSVVETKFGPQYGLTESKQKNDTTGSEQDNQKFLELSWKPTDLTSDLSSVDSRHKLSVESVLQGKPKRLDQSVKQTSKSDEETAFNNPGSLVNTDSGNLANMSDIEINDEAAWTRVEDLVKSGERVDVELVSCSTRGFVVSFGSLVGFLPYRNMPAKWKFLAFESWLKKKGLEPSNFRQNLGTITNYDAENRNLVPSSPSYMKIDSKDEEQISSDMKLEDLLRIYDLEKIKFLSSFIDQKIKVNVILADRKLRKLIFSVRPKEKEEFIEKKRNLMAKLQVGDIVKCCIQKITYFGIFVEVEGVTALIHQTEVSWNTTLDPASYFKIGQVVEAKVLQLDYALERISLSLKEVMPDPLMESLESVVGDFESLDGRLEVAQTDTEWSEVESLIQELQQIDGIQSVSKGRFFLSPGLAPTFQVYMASIFENQYKLLARSGNRIQEVMVQTSLDKDKMKSAILTCTNKVE